MGNANSQCWWYVIKPAGYIQAKGDGGGRGRTGEVVDKGKKKTTKHLRVIQERLSGH